MERIHPGNIQVVVNNVNSNEILLQDAKGINPKEQDLKTTEYFLEVQGQDTNVVVHQAQFVTIGNECGEVQDGESQYLPLEMDDNGQIILQDKHVIVWDELCRICANSSDKIVPIFSDEGLKHNLCIKIQNYLSLDITEHDSLPLQVCYNCAATLLAWHEMIANCSNAQQRLLDLQNKLHSKNQLQNNISDAIEVGFADNGTELEVYSNQENQMQVGADEEFATQTAQPPNEPETDRVEHSRQQQDQPETIKFTCGLCVKPFLNKKDLLLHMETYHWDETDLSSRFECNTCHKSYFDKSKLETHLRLHDRSQYKKSERFDEKRVADHAKTYCATTQKILYVCHFEQCKSLLKSRRNFLRHLRVHVDERPVICERCGKCYRNVDDLRRHIESVHDKVKRHECDICGRFYASKGTRDAHRRIHTQEKPYPCGDCGKPFRSLSLLNAHQRVHKDVRPFKCSYCPMAFRERQKCQHHESSIHTNEKPYSCDKCDRLFSAKGELNRHRTVHFPEHKPYVCAECKMGFRLSRYLRAHIKRDHANKAEVMLHNKLSRDSYLPQVVNV